MEKTSFISLLGAFLRPAVIGTIASVVGIANGVDSLLNSGGGGGGGGGAPYQYIPTGSGTADTSWQQALQQLMGQAGATSSKIDPVFLRSLMQGLKIDPTPLANVGKAAWGGYNDLGGIDRMFASMMGDQAQQGIGTQQSLLTAGFDPQQAMYNRERQQTVDTSRAADSARGLAMSPYSSGNESTAVQNFNTNWDFNQLQRMLQANQGANATGQLIGADTAASRGFSANVPQDALARGQALIGGQQAAAQFPAQVASQYAGNMAGSGNQWQQVMSQIIPYLYAGQGATQNAYQQFAGQQQFGANQRQQGVTDLLGGLGAAQTSANTPGSWLNGVFGSGGNGSTLDSGGYGATSFPSNY